MREVCSCCHQLLPIPPHLCEVEPIPGDYYEKGKWRSDGARCKICGRDLGWYCPNSEDHVCHYTKIYWICDNCGMPDERK